MTLPARMRAAAETIEELSSLYGLRFPTEAGWSANEIRNEIKHIEADTPSPWNLQGANCSGALAETEGGIG